MSIKSLLLMQIAQLVSLLAMYLRRG